MSLELGASAVARVDWVRTVQDDGMHCAVTDLAHWPSDAGSYWLAFRRGHRHLPFPPGDVVVVASHDLEHWQVRARITTGNDDRDPKLVVDGERLGVFFGSRIEELDADGEPVRGADPAVMVTNVSWTDDGRLWSLPRQVHGPNWWLWSPVRLEDGFWSTAYGSDLRPGAPAEVILAHSPDGARWRRHATLLGDREGNEGALWRLADGRMLALVRGTGDVTHLLEAEPPYEHWVRRELPHWIHAPAIAEVSGTLVVAGRDRREDGGYVTRLWELSPGGDTRRLVDLPSGGDTSYCGLVPDPEDAGALLVSYYSQHEAQQRADFRLGEKPSAVYLARVSLRE